MSDLSPLKQLNNLQQLDLMENKVSDLSPLKQLNNLQQLYLSGNQLSDLSVVIALQNLRYLKVDNNPNLNEPPKEIIDRGIGAIRNYFLQTEKQGKEKLYEAKVLFVGDAAVGKTSLMNKLLDENYKLTTTKNSVSTLGIDIREYQFPWEKDATKTFCAHFWDFGGQEVQYYIHQFFLTARSLYLLVMDDRIGNQNLDYWFRIIGLLGTSNKDEKSSLMIIQNEKNTKGQFSSFSPKEYEERYRDSFAAMTVRAVNLANTKDGRLATIKTEMERQLSNLKHIGDVLPSGWVRVRKALEQLKKQGTINHIPCAQFQKICEAEGITTEEDQLVLSGYLHDLGIILHYQEDENLCNWVFLNPHWVANAVYVILSDKELEKRNGRFPKSWIFKKWGRKYTLEEKNNFLMLMQKEVFDLCYKLNDNKDPEYLAPRLLCNCVPKMAEEWQFFQSLKFQFRYQFMPIGIITRIIVRLAQWIEKDQGEDVVWRDGVVLKKLDSRALVKESVAKDGARIIDIAINGSNEHNRRDLLTLIRSEVEEIHKNYKGIEVKRLIPCCCENCLRSDDPKMFEYE